MKLAKETVEKLEGYLGAIDVLTNKSVRLGTFNDPITDEQAIERERVLINTLQQVEFACDNLAVLAHETYAELLRRQVVRMRRDDQTTKFENPVR